MLKAVGFESDFWAGCGHVEGGGFWERIFGQDVSMLKAMGFESGCDGWGL